MTVPTAAPKPLVTFKRLLKSAGTWRRAMLAVAVVVSSAWLAGPAWAQGAPKVRIVTGNGDFLVDVRRPVAADPNDPQQPAAADLQMTPAPVPAATLAFEPVPAPEPAPALSLAPEPAPVLSPTQEPALAVTLAQPAEAPLATAALPVPASGAEKEVEAAVRAWADAWTGKDMNGYLSSYGQNFEPPGKQARQAWEEVRRARIVGKSRIRVKLSSFAVSVQGSKATAKFKQDYSGDALNISSRKTLELAKAGERWVIVKESTGS